MAMILILQQKNKINLEKKNNKKLFRISTPMLTKKQAIKVRRTQSSVKWQ